MFCPNCFSQVPDDVTICPFCKFDISKKKFRVNIPEENIADVFSSLPEKENEVENEIEQFSENTAQEELLREIEELDVPQAAGEERRGQVAQESEPEAEEPKSEPEEAQKPPVIRTAPKADPKRKKKEKRARIAVFAIVFVCAVCMAGLTIVSKKTDIFKESSDRVKTVALSGFTQSERSSFEDYAPFFSALASKGYSSQKTTQADLLALMKPEKSSGLYAAFYKPAKVITESADPAKRFLQWDGSCSYCKIEKDEIRSICKSLGVEAPDYANTEKFYYYDGYYYFAAGTKAASASSKYTVKVDSSKRTEDGNYYVQCTLTSPKGKAQTVYCLVALSKQDDKSSWSLLELSKTALFGEDGTKKQSKSKNALTYEIKKETYEAKTSGGVHFADYVIEYPFFTGAEDDEAAKSAATTLNALYADKLLKYKEKASSADKLYKSYKKNGCEDSDLPVYTYIHTKVTYNKKGYISLFEETNEYMPKSKAEEQTTEAYQAGIVTETAAAGTFPTTTFDSYTLEIKSGELIKKADLLGKEHQAVQQKLYEIYYKAHHSPDETTGEYEIPQDTENLGQQIYSSAWCLGAKGVLFSFCDSEGVAQSVLLPFSEVDGEIKL